MTKPNEYGIPNPNGCTYCGEDERGHAQVWLRSTGWHKWTAPSDKQRLERMKQLRAARQSAETFCIFCWADDCGGGCYG